VSDWTPPAPADAVAELDGIGSGDEERAHYAADDLLLENVHPDVAAAYERLIERCGGFWYA
jgi:hypothetical protein